MNETLYIDDIDIRSRFGIAVPSGGSDELFLFPALKEPKKTSWPEHDGVEVDLEKPVVQSKEIELTFLSNYEVNPADFVFFLSEPGRRKVRLYGREWELRLTEGRKNETWDRASRFSLSFVEDVPELRDPEAFTPGTRVDYSGFDIDDIPVNRYGLVIMSGKDELLKAPTTKKNLLRNLAHKHGQEYDTEKHYFNSKEVTFKCCLMASDLPNFWDCYDAFFRDLIAPHERMFLVEEIDEEFPCYYREMTSPKIVAISPFVAVTFDLTLEFTVIRFGKSEYLLAAETGEYLILEDDSDGEVLIDLEDF